MPTPSAEIPQDLRRRLDQEHLEFRILDAAEITDAATQEMVALITATFGRWPYIEPDVLPLDYLRWKQSGPASSMAAMQRRIDGRLVYVSSLFANWMRIDGARLLRATLVDISIARDLQGRGLFSLSAAIRPHLEGYSCDLSLHEQSQTRRNVSPLARKGQAHIANRVTSWFRILRPVAWNAHRGRLAESPAIAATWAMGGIAAAARRPGLRAAVEDRRDFDARFDVLFEEAARDFAVISERTSEFLRWRYGDRRAGVFVPRLVADGDRLLGYAIVRPKAPRAYLADLLALPGRPDVIEALVAASVEVAREAGAAGIECWLPRRHPYRSALRGQGFFDSGRDAGVQYHAVDAPPSALRVLQDPRARVHYTIGDTDVV